MLDGTQTEADAKARLQLGQLLEHTRRSKQLQRNQVANLISVSNVILSSVENGETWPSDVVWEELSKLYGLPVDMMAGMKRTALSGLRQPVAAKTQALNNADNVLVLDNYRKQPWQPTTTLNPD